MNLASILIVAGLADSLSWAGTAVTLKRPVVVCRESSSDRAETYVARFVASSVFERIGVGIEWPGKVACRSVNGAIRIQFSIDTPANDSPGALAYARLYEGVHIVVFYDRIKSIYPNDKVPYILGYVLAHEITHVLQGCPRHSESGIMKARWDWSDVLAMSNLNLTFTQDDVDLIDRGLDRWESQPAP